jgi:hypothetical protein
LRTFRWLAVPVIALALVGTACSSDEDGDDDSSEATATEMTETTATSDTTATATEGSSGGEDIDLASIFGGFGTASFNVTFNMEGDSAGEAMTGEWTWIQDTAGNRTRFEVNSDGQNIVMITTAEQTLVCAEGSCFDAGGTMGASMPDIGDMFTDGIDEVQADASGGTVRRIDGRTIAGVDTECVEFDGGDGTEGTACYAEGGIPLLIDSTTADGAFHMEASRFSTDISDADFEAPFPIVSVGG